MQIKNASRRTTYDFMLNGDKVNGQPPIATLKPGEEGEFDVDMEAEAARLKLLAEAGEIEGPELPEKKPN